LEITATFLLWKSISKVVLEITAKFYLKNYSYGVSTKSMTGEGVQYLVLKEVVPCPVTEVVRH
jgi:hypothetical protein